MAERVLFLSPHYPVEMEEFTAGLKEVGAEVWGVADVPREQLPDGVRAALSDYCRVDWRSEDEAVAAVERWLHGRTPDRIETLWEPLVMIAARLREHFDVQGMDYETAAAFRDKDLMKEKLRAAGIRVARSRRVTTAAELREGSEAIGFPVIIKPIAGAGSADTYRLDSQADVDRVLPLLGHVSQGSLEEFIEGEEFTFDAVSLDGIAVFHSITKYYPPPLQARSNEWISPAQLTYRDPDIAEFSPAVALGFSTLIAMEMDTGFSHMEWFRKADGELVVGEIACRSGGGHLVDMMNWANDFSIHREWANAVANGRYEGRPARAYNVAMVFKRAHGQGRITAHWGLGELKARLGGALVRDGLLPLGAPRRDWRQTLVSDGYLAVRHAEREACLDMMDDIIRNLRVEAG